MNLVLINVYLALVGAILVFSTTIYHIQKTSSIRKRFTGLLNRLFFNMMVTTLIIMIFAQFFFLGVIILHITQQLPKETLEFESLWETLMILTVFILFIWRLQIMKTMELMAQEYSFLPDEGDQVKDEAGEEVKESSLDDIPESG
ncbi:MAG: hypothetical protein ABH950_08460 [Candidatus Altiarchaeota archaeon]